MMNPFVVLTVVVLIGWIVLKRSAQRNEKQFWARRAISINPDAHAWADTSPSKSAWAWCFVIAVIGGFIIVKTGGF